MAFLNAKNLVSVKDSTGRMYTQKRLLLTNIKEMYVEFKQRIKLNIGLSKFCELRPKWCVTVDSSGMHSVCVCQIHQNLKSQSQYLRLLIKQYTVDAKCSRSSLMMHIDKHLSSSPVVSR